MQNSNTSLVTEIGMIVLAALLVIGGVVLIFFGKITFIDFSPFLVAVLGLFGINVAYKAPSPAQSQQLNNQQQQLASVQELARHAANMAHVHADPAPQPAVPVQAPVNLAPVTANQSAQFQPHPSIPGAVVPQVPLTSLVQPSGFTSLELPAVTQ